MEKKLENAELNNETMKDVSGGIIEQASGSVYGRVAGAGQNLDALNLIDNNKQAGAGFLGLYNIVPTDAVEDKNWRD